MIKVLMYNMYIVLDHLKFQYNYHFPLTIVHHRNIEYYIFITLCCIAL